LSNNSLIMLPTKRLIIETHALLSVILKSLSSINVNACNNAFSTSSW
jgi:hypothetical protein